MRKVKRFTAILLMMAVALVGCGSEGISQEEYDKVVAERDELQKENERLQKNYDTVVEDLASLQASITIDEIINETEQKAANEEYEDSSETLLYEDDNVKIYFKGIGEKGVEFWIENLTDLNITIQADTVSINGISTDDIMMSDDVAPQSKGKVIAKCEDFENGMSVETVGGQLRIVDFSKTWDPYYYDVKFINIKIQ